jgi:hypothetical protein
MSLAMNGVGGFLVRGLDEAECFAGGLIEPILVVRDSVLGLNLHVLLVSSFDRFGGQAIDLVMNIHVEGHSEPPSESNGPLWYRLQRQPTLPVGGLA